MMSNIFNIFSIDWWMDESNNALQMTDSVLFLLLAIPVAYLFLCALFSLGKYKNPYPAAAVQHRFLVLFTVLRNGKEVIESVNRFLDKTVCDSYRFMAKRVPAMFGRLYKQTNRQNLFSDLVPKLSGLFSNLLYPTIAGIQPDVILTTHPFATEMVSDLKADGTITAPLICILTDYGVHRAWIAPHVDAYVVASEDMVPELTSFGVPEEKIYPFGIPVHGVFFNREDRDMILRDLRLDPKLPTLLFMAGSFGVSNIIKLYRDLEATDVKIADHCHHRPEPEALRSL